MMEHMEPQESEICECSEGVASVQRQVLAVHGTMC